MIPQDARAASAKLIAAFEGLHKRVPGSGLVVPYPDPFHGWNVPTVGYGVVCARDAGPFTPEQCVAMLLGKIEREYGPGVLKASPTLAQQKNLWRFAAAVSFAWNLGIGAYRASGMRAAIDRSEWKDAAANCVKWHFSAGLPRAGLLRRRQIEARMLMATYRGD